MNKTIKYYSDNAQEFMTKYDSIKTIKQSWHKYIPSEKSLILNIGSGSGRDSDLFASKGHEVLSVEPADNLRKLASSTYKHNAIHWINDSLPSLKKVRSAIIKYDLILINAVWMHLKEGPDRTRAFRIVSSLLKPGGKLIITLRHGSSPDNREMFPISALEIINLASKNALEVISDTKSIDIFNRENVSWQTIVCKLQNDETEGLPLIRNIIVNDKKSSTYKPALLRILTYIADTYPGSVLNNSDDNFVIIPSGLVGFIWVKLFKELILNSEIPQLSGNRNAGFASAEFNSLINESPSDLEIGNILTGKRAENLAKAIKQAIHCIKIGPVTYIKYPNTKKNILSCDYNRINTIKEFTINNEFFEKFGTFKIPRIIWNSLSMYRCWIEPAIIDEWISLMKNYAISSGIEPKTYEEYQKVLAWTDTQRRTNEIRLICDNIKKKGKSIFCIWSGKKLNHNYDIDHCFPFIHWPNNDLWNLMPTSQNINRSKSDKIISSKTFFNAKERIFNWWDDAYKTTHLNRFEMEAKFSFPLFQNDEDLFKQVYLGIQNQRTKLLRDQGLSEFSC